MDKVQVYERKSEESELTGIDDGQRFQTVNVVLKEEARVGLFGNIEGHLGTEELYTANLFAAKFNRTERIGLTANTNNMGANAGGREGSLRMNSQITGEPRNTSVGANYENQFFQKKLNVNANYNFNDASNRNERERYNKEIISSEEVQETNSLSQNSNNNQGHSFRSIFRFRPNTKSNMDVHFNARKSQSSSWSASENYMINNSVDSIRDYRSENNSTGDSQSSEISINYRRRLKEGQALNLLLSNKFDESNQQSDVFQRTYLHKEDKETIVDQNRLSDSRNYNFNSQIHFSNRINQNLNYSLGYNLGFRHDKNKVDAFNKLANNDELDLQYSQNQINKSSNNTLLANLNFNAEKVSVSLSNRTNYRSQKLTDSYRDIDLSRNFWDNNLNLSGNYKISNRKNHNR
ncbi:hypothetical protein [Sphingobacterium sp. T2]|uniref:hypothetical protein n=1 Tax=Sphingobacterium sp. T2 TaxID=1590596 RepID=UPI0012E077C4|nr:hypothetical protein [Sphingobacterium sp. T2]